MGCALMDEPRKFSLDQQLEEVQRELDKRNEVYPGLVRKGVLRQSVADFHIARMLAVQRTLRWLYENQAAMVEVRANKKAQEEIAARNGVAS